ncbi:MAG: hypothetical protein K0U37_01975 [Gammaproteobacteria bacterium]|nr:hypothetical protein [Gammaproteobacteria bacterium]
MAETAKLYRVIDRLHQAGLLGPSEAFNSITHDDVRDEEALAAQDWTQRQFI